MTRSKYDIDWKTVWAALGALGTLLAVLFAIYHQEIRRWIDSPVLEFEWFEPNPPHLSEQIALSYEQDGAKPYNGFFIAINLINTGNMVASDVQPMLMKVGFKDKDGNWKLKKWIPIPLQWALYDPFRPLRSERDLVTRRPYLFYVGSFSSRRPGKLLITYFIAPIQLSETIEPGEHCLEISASSSSAKNVTKYIYVKFEDFKDEGGQKIRDFVNSIEMKDNAPW
jgi:hypothetical protein